MKSLIRIAVASVLLLAANSVFAQYVDGTEDNTDAGTYVNNVVTVEYEVNGVAQTAEDNTTADGADPDSDPDGAQFVVDRVVMFTVANTSGDNVTPGQDTADTPPPTLTFTVTNDSNDTLDFILSTEDLAGDDFDATGIEIYVDANANGTYDPATDLATSISDLPEEGVATVFVIADIPLSAANTEFDDLVLVATAYETDGTTVVTDDSGVADTASTVETVFGDGDGTGTEGAEDGVHSATGRFTVASATIAVTKSSVVLNDPFNATTNPKAIPGAEVLYCIEIANTGGTVAENVSVRDPVPAGTTYVNESIEVFTAGVTCGAAIVGTGTSITDDDSDAAAEDTANAGISGNSGDTTAMPAETTDTVVNTTVSSVSATTGVTATIFRVIVD